MQATRYTMKWAVELSFEEAERRTRQALQEEGFGIITEIDVQATLKDKLGVESEPCRILGACQPALAYRALQAEPDVSVLLPCNVVVRQREGRTEVVAFDPVAGLGLFANPALEEVGREARERLERALAGLS